MSHRFHPLVTFCNFAITGLIVPFAYFLVCLLVYVGNVVALGPLVQLMRQYEGFHPLSYVENCPVSGSFCTGTSVESAILTSVVSGIRISPDFTHMFTYVVFPLLSVTYKRIPTSIDRLRLYVMAVCRLKVRAVGK